MSADKFAILDLDADGEDELILWIQINGESDCGFEVLHAQDEAVFGYTLQYRSIMNLKTDGTFEFSGGSADTGIGKLKFSKEGPVTENLAYSESSYDADNELTVEYFADEKACSEEEFNTVMNEQAEKPDVDWYELTADGVKAAFDEQAERR